MTLLDHVKQALDNAQVLEVRPGVLLRSIVMYDTEVITITATSYVCQTCRVALTKSNDAPILRDVLWRQLYPNDGVVCMSCLQERVRVWQGRELRLSDLKRNISFNDPFWVKLRPGKKVLGGAAHG